MAEKKVGYPKILGLKLCCCNFDKKASMIGETTHITCRQLATIIPILKQELPSWIYVRGKIQFKSIRCLDGIECSESISFHGWRTNIPVSRLLRKNPRTGPFHDIDQFYIVICCDFRPWKHQNFQKNNGQSLI